MSNLDRIAKSKGGVTGTKLDKRAKLSPDDRKEIQRIRKEEGTSYQKLADMYGVSKKLVILLCNPESAAKAKASRLEYVADGRLKKYYQGEQRAIQSKRVADWRARIRAMHKVPRRVLRKESTTVDDCSGKKKMI